MAIHSPMIIADYILAKRVTRVTPLHINKLAYISHGFTLAIHDERLVNEPVEAWTYGPVFPSLYYALQRFGGDDVPALLYCNTDVTASGMDERVDFLSRTLEGKTEIIDMVMEKYGNLSGSALITLTHRNGTPWKKFYKKGRLGVVIPNEAIRQHYKDIINGTARV